jgi:hypothetical protein
MLDGTWRRKIGMLFMGRGKHMQIEKNALFSSAALECLYRPCKINFVYDQHKAWPEVHHATHPASMQGESENSRWGCAALG